MAAIIQMMEGAALAMAHTLATYLPAVLTDIAAAYAANDQSEFGFAVPLPAPVAIYTREVFSIPLAPAIIVTPVGGTEVADGAPDFGELQHHLDVAVFCMADQMEIAEAQANRYLQAIWTVIKLHQQLDGSLSGLAGVSTLKYGKSPVASPTNTKTIIGWMASWEVLVNIVESVAS